jgi:hypothetical protein
MIESRVDLSNQSNKQALSKLRFIQVWFWRPRPSRASSLVVPVGQRAWLLLRRGECTSTVFLNFESRLCLMKFGNDDCYATAL